MRLALIALLLSGCALGTWNPKRPDHTAVGECSDVLPYKKGPDNTGELYCEAKPYDPEYVDIDEMIR